MRQTGCWREPDSNRWSLAERPALGRVSKKSVEQQLDAKDEAWPTGRQRSQSHAPFYESAEPNIPAAPYCRIPGYQVSRTTASV